MSARPQRRTPPQLGSAMRQARTCYDHLAGVAGVELLDQLLGHGWLAASGRSRRLYRVTPAGARALVSRGADLERAHRARRIFAYSCLDWTERRPHVGGALGAEILEALTGRQFIRRTAGTRAVLLLKPIRRWYRRGGAPSGASGSRDRARGRVASLLPTP